MADFYADPNAAEVARQAEEDEGHEELAATLAPGETLPWVAAPPSGVAEERAIEAEGGEEAEESVPSDEDAEGTDSDVPSSRTEDAEQKQVSADKQE